MKVLLGCEESQAVTIAFRKRGVEAYSCDLLPCSGGHPEWHIKGDVIKEAYSGKYDKAIFFPPCTYMTNSGVRWLHTDPKRWILLFEAADLFVKLWNAPIAEIGMENPIMHKYAKRLIGVEPSQIIQPWQFGHGETKATCLWLKNLPLLRPTNIVSGREQRIWKMPPGEERSKLRSKTFEGIAEAMADQWSNVNQLKLAI
jgi:hypothetical protein